MRIYCCGCERDVNARLTDGVEIYPHRRDLYSLPFWRCDKCGNFVGCHHKTKDRIRPLGCIPTPAIRRVRQQIHRIMDPLWQSGVVDRRELYAGLSRSIGREYHTAEIRSVDEAHKILNKIAAMNRSIPDD